MGLAVLIDQDVGTLRQSSWNFKRVHRKNELAVMMRAPVYSLSP